MARIHALVFAIDDHRYALDTRDVVEVISRVELRPIHRAPPELSGVFVYRGEVVPVFDLAELLARKRCSERFSSRILITRLPSRSGGSRLVGLLAEHVTEAMHIEAGESEMDPAVSRDGITADGAEMIRIVRPEVLVGHAADDALSLALRCEP